MSFLCTRGGICDTASQAILRGIAPNGGLYVPSSLITMTMDEQITLCDLLYHERAKLILSFFLDDFTSAEISGIVHTAYSHFDDPAVAPLVKVKNGIHILELFHGPTLAFKDMALQILPYLMTMSARKNGENREIAVLVATSGDTGKAALEGFRDVPGTSCTVFFPLGGVSRIQELQMTTTGGSNTHVIGIRGNFDDAQSGVKRLFTDQGFVERMDSTGRIMSSANSINLGRLLPQIVYYFSACSELIRRNEISWREGVNVVVPTGNFGNILAAWYARQMGAPIRKLICASNKNNVLTEFISTGVYRAKRPFYTTISPSMDILVSSNLERLLFDLSGQDGNCIQSWMDRLFSQGEFDIGKDNLSRMRECFFGGYADDHTTRETIARIWREDRYLCDPHTAVAESVLKQYRTMTGDDSPALVVSTASPYKFAAEVAGALGICDVQGDPFVCAALLAEYTGQQVPVSVSSLKNLPVRHLDSCDREDMGEAVFTAYHNVLRS